MSNVNSNRIAKTYLKIISLMSFALLCSISKPGMVKLPAESARHAAFENITIEGVVRDEEGKLIKDATVAVKGTKNNTVTNEKGAFRLTEVAVGSTLTITHSSYEFYTIEVTGVTTLDVIVLQKRSSFNVNSLPQTNDVNSLLSKQQRLYPEPDLDKGSVLSAPEAYTIKMYCGQRRTESGKEPLVVVNGKIWKYDVVMDKIKPDDIQSIEVLKNELSLAEYGPDAVNGVIILKTKKN